MASQMVIQPSQDTLFIRGFSSRKDVEDIRDYFEKEARSKVTIEFLKQTESDDRLYVALKFDTKDIAREILNRFDDTYVLGDRITLSWFKDLRRFRGQGRIDRDRRGRFDQHDYYNNRGYNDRRYNQGRSRRDMDRSRVKSSRKYKRSRSHSRSPSYSRSRSRSRDRRDQSRSLSPVPKHRVKSAVEQPSKRDDSDNERSSPMKESSMSPDRAYSRSPEPLSPGDDKDKDYSPSLDDRKDDDGKRKESQHDDDDLDQDNTPSGRYKRASESYDDSRYSEEKYGGSSRQSRSQQQSQRYMGDYDERESQQDNRWSRGALQDPSPDRSSERVERMSNTSLERERGNMDRPGLEGMGRGSMERMTAPGASGGVVGDYGGRGYPEMYDRNMWDPGMMQQGRRAGYPDGGPPMRDGKNAAGDAERWPGMDGPPQMGRWPGGQQPDKMGGGAGWSQQTMAMIQEKKDDIERVYKNDCETFVSVVKMLINKDPQLEDRLQQSLRENLKDVGQRCILELREFIDRLREKEETPIPGLGPV